MKNRREIIRAGATYPSAVSTSYFQTPYSPAAWKTDFFQKRTDSTSDGNNRPQPAFGATRFEGAAVSPDADTAGHPYQRRRRSACCSSKRNASKAAPLESPVAKGPTAETIISMTASGQKPPLPDEEQIRKQRECLLGISEAMGAAVENNTNRKGRISFETDRNVEVVTIKIPGYHQTWGVAFANQEYTPQDHHSGPGEARFSQNYTPGSVRHR